VFEDSWAPWERGGANAEEVRDLGDGRVLVRGDWGGVGIASGAETYMDLSTLYTVRDDQISKVEYYFDRAKALEAAGLQE
jgi:ketosteroid isomerase-like protein